jgi:transcriptional antiterminator RfaH
MLRWYLVHTKPRGEAVAEANLRRQGYDIYLPRLAHRVLSRYRWRERVQPLFPRYLFLQLAEGSQALAPVQSSMGVSSVVRFGATYAVVPDGIIDELRSRAEPQSGLHRLNRIAPPVPGEAIKITMKPFDGLAGIFERACGNDRVLVLLRLLGQETSLRLPAHAVVPERAA